MTTRFRVENFHHKVSVRVKVKFSLLKQWNIVIKEKKKKPFTPFRVFSTEKRVVLRLKIGNLLS